MLRVASAQRLLFTAAVLSCAWMAFPTLADDSVVTSLVLLPIPGGGLEASQLQRSGAPHPEYTGPGGPWLISKQRFSDVRKALGPVQDVWLLP